MHYDMLELENFLGRGLSRMSCKPHSLYYANLKMRSLMSATCIKILDAPMLLSERGRPQDFFQGWAN